MVPRRVICTPSTVGLLTFMKCLTAMKISTARITTNMGQSGPLVCDAASALRDEAWTSRVAHIRTCLVLAPRFLFRAYRKLVAAVFSLHSERLLDEVNDTVPTGTGEVLLEVLAG